VWASASSYGLEGGRFGSTGRGGQVGGGAGAYLRGYGGFLAQRCAPDRARCSPRFDLVEVHNMPDLLTAAAFVPGCAERR
jgi:hypothetical protein